MPLTAIQENRATGDRLADYEMRLRLARASELAILGHLEGAERVLCMGGISRACAAELDLLARIHVRQGRFNDASRRWEAAIERDAAGGGEYRECLRVLAEFNAELLRRRILEWRIAVGLSAAAFVLACLILVSWLFRSNG